MKQRMIISLEPRQIATLKRLSRERKKSMADIVRRELDKLVEKEQKNPASLLLEWLEKNENMLKKAFKNVEPTLSEDIDKILYGQK